MPKFYEQRYEEYYNKRKGEAEICLRELGRKPYSFYLINKIAFN